MTTIFNRYITTAAISLTSVAVSLVQLPSAEASLQDCNTSAPTQLPIGYNADDGHLYRSALYQFLSNTTLASVSYPAGWLPQDHPSLPDTAYFSRAPSIVYGLYDYDRDFNGTSHLLTNPHQNNSPVNAFWSTCISDWNSSGLTLSSENKRQLEQLWMLYTLAGQDLGSDVLALFHHDPANYLLANIEDTVNCEARVPKTKLFSLMLWFAQWDYPGNAMSTPAIADVLARRAAVSLALGLIMTDYQTFNANYALNNTQPVNGEQFVHPPLTTYGSYVTPVGTSTSAVLSDYVLNMARQYEYIRAVNPSWLSQSDAEAMEEGLARMVERLQRMRLFAGQMNRFYQTAHATAAVKRALDGTIWQQLAANVHDAALQEILNAFRPVGFYPDDGNGYDIAYNQHNLNHALNLLLTDAGSYEADLKEHAHAIAQLEAHMIFTDRTGRHYSPSAMSVRTGAGLTLGRQLTAGEHAIGRLAASELRFSNNDPVLPFVYARTRDMQDVSSYQPHSSSVTQLIDPASSNTDFHAEILCRHHPNHDLWELSPLSPASQTPPHWDEHSWQYGRPRYGIELHEVDDTGDSILRRHADTLASDPTSRRLPFEHSGPYIRNLDDQFVFVKFGGEGVYFEGNPSVFATNEYQQANGNDFATLLHIGPVAGASGDIPRGYGGGQIAALWAPGGGIFSLNRRKGYNYPAPNRDSWLNNEWAALPIHAVTLIDAHSDWVSSARIDTPSTSASFALLPSPGPAAEDFLDQGSSGIANITSSAPESANVAFVEVAGDFSDEHYSITNGTLSMAQTPAHYRRRLVVSEEGIRVRTELLQRIINTAVPPTPPYEDYNVTLELPEVLQAWESIPLWLAQGSTATGNVASEITLIDYLGQPHAVPSQASSAWVPYNGIETVVVVREEGTMFIHFDEPQNVTLSPEWDNQPSRNLLIDLTLQAASASNATAQSPEAVQLDPVSVGYTITFESSA